MKKVLLTAMTILSVASASVFGMYGNDSGWMDFLVHGNQMRTRLDQFGVTLGNGTIKGTIGLKANSGFFGDILKQPENTKDVLLATTVSAGIGYTSEPFGIGVGYNFNFAYDKEKKELNKNIGVHTPVLAINALNNNFRLVVPVQIATSSSHREGAKDYMGISTEAQIRYYTGIDAFSAVRLYVRYGQAGYKDVKNVKDVQHLQSSFGIEGRFYFLNSTVGNVALAPFVKVRYDMGLEGESTGVTAGSYNFSHEKGVKSLDHNPYDLTAIAALGLTANSDTVSLYVEPSLGYSAKDKGKKDSLTHSLVWGTYGEIYITPVKDLEWYFEASVNGASADDNKVGFASSTGLTWYLPSFQE